MMESYHQQLQCDTQYNDSARISGAIYCEIAMCRMSNKDEFDIIMHLLMSCPTNSFTQAPPTPTPTL